MSYEGLFKQVIEHSKNYVKLDSDEKYKKDLDLEKNLKISRFDSSIEERIKNHKKKRGEEEKRFNSSFSQLKKAPIILDVNSCHLAIQIESLSGYQVGACLDFFFYSSRLPQHLGADLLNYCGKYKLNSNLLFDDVSFKASKDSVIVERESSLNHVLNCLEELKEDGCSISRIPNLEYSRELI